MPSIPANLARVSNGLRMMVATGNLTRTQVNLMQVQNQLATGKRLGAPSDDPGSAAIIQSLRKTLEQRDAYLQNLRAGQNQLGAVDTALGEASNLVREAQQIASANVGSDVTADARSAAATVIDRLYAQLVSVGNRQFEGTYLFAGDRSTAAPFVEAGGGVQFVGSKSVLANDFDEGTTLPFQVDGDTVFGALSTRIQGATDLAPSLAFSTRLSDLRGATDDGVRLGQIVLSNGATAATVDLTGADTLGDVVDRINNAGVGSITAAIATDGISLELSAGPADNITVSDPTGGTTASDLGILRLNGAGPGASLDGTDVGARVTRLTPLTALRGGLGLDPTGLTITNGLVTRTIDLSTAGTVEDLLNAVNGSGTNVRAEINAAGTGINLLNPTQGIELRVSENGGATAGQLGLRSFAANSPLSELNAGKGVRTVSGDDFTITDSAGVSFGVDIEGFDSIQDILGAINSAAGSAGAGVTASFASSGNGLVLTDTAAGAGTLAIANAAFSRTVEDLGLDVPAAGGVIAGRDVNAVQSQGLFANVIALQKALRANDQRGITLASEALQGDLDRVIRTRGEVGARVQELEARQTRIEDQNVATQKLLSEVEDVDFTEAITRFQQLQTALQASLQTAGATLNTSLLDFLS